MQVTIFQTFKDYNDVLDRFADAAYTREMPHLLSDLLAKGLNTLELSAALKRAMTACKMSGTPVRKHFYPIYSSHQSGNVKDCKLTALGYGLVLLNASPKNAAVANWQVDLLQSIFGK